MEKAQKEPRAFLPLTPAMYQILIALADGERHGYAIMREVDAQTLGGIRLGPATLYTSLKRLRAAGLVEENGDRPDPRLDDERRRYYRLSGLGRQAAIAETDRLEALVTAARRKPAFNEASAT
jgi:DNA-binding PadR family transcriptional regulator